MGSFTLVLKTLTTIMAVVMLLSPAPAIFRVLKSKKVEHLSVLPIVSMLAAAQIWMLYGYTSDNWFPMFGTYMFGDIAASFYLVVYYTYTTERAYVLKFVLGLAAWIVVSTLYVVLASNEIVGDKHTAYKITGYIGVVGSLVLYASPFETMVQVVRTKNAISIPILMVCVGTVSNTLWTVYGLVTDDWFVTIPNGTTVIFGVVQIVLYVMYNPKKMLDQRLPVVLSPVDGKMTTQWELVKSPTLPASTGTDSDSV